MIEEKKMITAEEKARRAEAVKQAFASFRLERIEPSDETKKKAQLFINGDIEAEDLV